MRRVDVIVALACVMASACAKSPAEPETALRFTQHFYEWYVPHAGFEAVVRDSAQLLGPELLAALRQDMAASAADSEEVVGLDWDPFLASQDPCETYQAGSPTQSGDTTLVEVRGICAGKPAGPLIIAQVRRYPSGWRFVNFRYDENPDLLRELETLRRERSTAP
jgi:hypothetical protein